MMLSPLDRRSFLRILAGVPLVIGLPRLARAGEGDDATAPASGASSDIEKAIAAARADGRGVLLIAAPVHDDPYHPETFARRARLARHLAELLETDDAATRLLLGQLAVIVATAADLEREASLRAKSADRAAVWLLAPGTDAPAAKAETIAVALDGDDAEAARLPAALRARVFGEELGWLKKRCERELEALDEATRAEVRRALQRLSHEEFAVREEATAWLAERRGKLLATLTITSLLAGTDPEARSRCAGIAAPSARPQPLGARWLTFHGGCVQTDPYTESIDDVMVDCGMARTTEPAREYLDLTAGRK